MSPWRDFADPHPSDARGDRRTEGRALRADVPFDVALRVAVGSAEKARLATWLEGGGPVAALPASDLARAVAEAPRSGIAVVCGTAQIAEPAVVGVVAHRVAGSATKPGRLLDVVDPDAALPGPWEFDLLGLALEAVLSSRPSRRRAAVLAVGSSYRDAIESLARRPLHARMSAARARAASLATGSPSSAFSPEHAVDELVRDGRLRAKRVARRWGSTQVRRAGADVEIELAQYRESLPDPDASLLSGYRVADAVEDEQGRLLVLLARAGRSPDEVLLEGLPAQPSPLEDAFGVWRHGSDVHRVLAMRGIVPLVPADFPGWSTRRDGSVTRAWWRARSTAAAPSTHRAPSRDSRPKARGSGGRSPGSGHSARQDDFVRRAALLGLVHGRTGDASLLAGYLGGSPRFPRALAESVLAVATA